MSTDDWDWISSDQLEEATTTAMTAVSAALAKFECERLRFECKHDGDVDLMQFARKQAADLHSFVCSRLRRFGRRQS